MPVFMPKPPPTSPTVTRTCSGPMPSTSVPSELRTPEGIWLLMRSVNRPSSATQASTERGSIETAATRWLAIVSCTTCAACWKASAAFFASPMRISAAKKAADAFQQAAHVVQLTIANQRVAAVSIEPRSVLAWVADDGRLTLRMSSQMPSGVRNSLGTDVLGIGPEQVRVTVGDVGGGFGMKTGIYPEDAAVAWSAWTLKRPVKWIADRSEEFLSSFHGRDQRAQAELALAADGRILALRLRTLANVGAYATATGLTIPMIVGPWVQTSVYDIPLVDFQIRCV